MKDKTIIITGASSGIGEHAAKTLAKQGAIVCLIARREDELQRVCNEITQTGGSAYYYPTDLSDTASIDACTEKLLAEHQRIDVLVNNAARSIRRSIKDSLDRFHDYQRTMQLNYFGAVYLTQKILPVFIQQNSGHVINVSTQATQAPVALFSAYLASKHALNSFSNSINSELYKHNIVATTIYYPLVRTDMSQRTDIYNHAKMMNVEKAADWIVNAIKKRPIRVSLFSGIIAELFMAATPKTLIRYVWYLIYKRDKRLAKKQAKQELDK